MITGALGDRAEGNVEPAQQVGELRGLITMITAVAGAVAAAGSGMGSGLVPGPGVQGCWPRAQPCAIAVPSGPVTVTHHRDRGCSEAACTRRRVSSGSSEAQRAGLAGRVRPAQQGAGRDDQVDQGGQRRQAAGRGAGAVRSAAEPAGTALVLVLVLVTIQAAGLRGLAAGRRITGLRAGCRPGR